MRMKQQLYLLFVVANANANKLFKHFEVGTPGQRQVPWDTKFSGSQVQYEGIRSWWGRRDAVWSHSDWLLFLVQLRVEMFVCIRR